ncbi:MAG: SDR family NAD(P)-dependent oxidoreductase [Hyphomicrobiales bacterium]|nr:SDR family NAD(P)-dependent oxidoreductase [Hyphomicrobiales bacterium]MCP5000339.1 SDR family NAD(P)-dependent oxidoreductase [Hyphomicrobiales bacterium]
MKLRSGDQQNGSARSKSHRSGFGAKTPAADIVKDVDLTGKNVIVTGGYSGIGLETVRALAGAGAAVTVPARNREKAEEALNGVEGDVTIAVMDLADVASVRRFADDYVSSERPLHILINNAGIMACPEARVGPGWESQFGVNHLGHMALALELLPAMRKAGDARVVGLSSTAHIQGGIDSDDPHFQSRPYDKWATYAQAKSANALFAMGLDSREQANGIRAFSVHPGGILTLLQRHLPEEEMVALGWKNADGTMPPAVAALFKTPEQGASTSVWAATSVQLDGMGGVYCEDCDVARLADDGSQRWEHVRTWVCDPESAERLWKMSEDMLATA